jgi:hypothetical protein
MFPPSAEEKEEERKKERKKYRLLLNCQVGRVWAFLSLLGQDGKVCIVERVCSVEVSIYSFCL